MANSAQARKRARQAEDRRQRNASARSRMRTFVKKAQRTVTTGDKDAATADFRVAARLLDSAVTKGLIHKNTAARKKSRINARIRALSEGSESAAG